MAFKGTRSRGNQTAGGTWEPKLVGAGKKAKALKCEPDGGSPTRGKQGAQGTFSFMLEVLAAPAF